MIKKIFYIITTFVIIILTSLIFVKEECFDFLKTAKVAKEFGFHILKNCKENAAIKKFVYKYDFFSDKATYIWRKYFNPFNADILDFEQSKKTYNDLQNEYFPQFNNGKNLFIEGEINKKNESKLVTKYFDYYSEDSGFRQNKDNYNSKFYHSIEVDKKNIHTIKLLWKYDSLNNKDSNIRNRWIENIETSPIYSKGKIFFISADRKLNCVNIKNGKLIWKKDLLFQPVRRGFLLEVSINENEEFIFLPVEDKIYKLDAKSGLILNNFGKNGYLEKVKTAYSPVIFKNYLIVVDQISKSIIAFDKISGDKKFTVGLFSQKRNYHGANPWGGMALDDIRGIVYVVTGNPNPYSLGHKRKGSNEGSNSIVAIDIIKKKIIWSFQETIHDLWNLDLAYPPVLTTVNINQKSYDVVIVISKVGNTIMLDRVTGRPIFDIYYKKVPISDVPNEITSPYQIYINKPEPVTTFNWDPAEAKEAKINYIEEYKYGWYEPMSINIPYVFKADGPAWEGGAVNHKLEKLYTTVNHTPTLVRLYANSMFPHSNIPKDFKEISSLYFEKCSSCHGKNRNGKYEYLKLEGKEEYVPSLVGYYLFPNLKKRIENFEIFKKKHTNLKITLNDYKKLNSFFQKWDEDLKNKKRIQIKYKYLNFVDKNKNPVGKKPFGEIVAIDLPSGKIQWRAPFGYKIINGKEIKVGTFNKGGLSLSSNNIIFATGTSDQKIVAIDGKNGEEVWSFKMDTPGSSPPILFAFNKKKYLAVNSTGGYNNFISKKGSSLYLFELP